MECSILQRGRLEIVVGMMKRKHNDIILATLSSYYPKYTTFIICDKVTKKQCQYRNVVYDIEYNVQLKYVN